MGPFASVILQWALLPGAAIRDSLKPESLVLDAGRDGCLEEAKRIEQLMRDLAYPGPLEGNHCDWPGITCWQNCRVEKIECENCSGHLPEKIELRHLWEVSLTSPTLTGNIKAFSGIQLLNSLELKGTEITGELEVFREDNFVRLLLADTKISGNLQSLARMELRELDLSGTAISGDLQSLVGDVDWYSSESISKRRLRHLKLGRTNITGRLSSLTRFPILKEVDLSYTSVSGWVDSSWRNKCKDLLILQLRKTSVQFVPVGEELERLKDHWTGGRLRLFPKLKELDVTHCPVNNTVENLLLPLAMSQLSTIKAAAAGISGVVPQLAKELTNLNAAKELEDVHFILPDNLVILDLSFNNITGVNGLPVLPHSGRVLLRENSQLVVPSKVLTEALKQEIILDLSGTNLSNKEEIAQLLAKGEVKTTDMYAHRNDLAGYACKDLVGTVKVAPETFVPDEMCKCLAGWHGHGATCQICPADQFSDEMGLDICKMCPPNSTAPEGSTKLAHCTCDFGNLHNGTCSCDKHHALIKGDCVLCSKLHLQCNTSGVSASSALPEISFTRLQRSAEEAHRCLPPGELERCPGNHQCGLGYDGTLCATCAAGFWAKAGRCRPCAEMNSTSIWYAVFLGVAALVVAAFLAYRHVFLPRQVAPPVSVKSLLQKLITLKAPVLLQMVQLWSVLSRLGRSSSSPSGGSSQSLPEVPYLEALQLTTTELQNSLNLQCAFNAETVRMLAALSSPVAPLLLLACCAALELYRAGFGVSMALKTLTLLFIGGASSASELLSCQSVDGDGESLGDFAFRKAIRHLRCSETDGVAFWVDMVGYSSALAYGVLIPLFLVGLMVRQYFALQEARLFYASAEGGTPQHVTLRLQTLHGQLPEEALPKRLLAAVAAHMAVHCRGKWLVQLQDGYISATSSGGEEIPADHLDLMKVVADAKTSRNIDVLRSRRVAEMLTERIMLEEAKDRWLIGSQALLCKYMLCQDVWMHLVMKLFAVALVSCVSMSDAWKWAIAFSLGMAVLVGACQLYMWPQVSQLQSLSCFCLALASLAFVYDCAWLARIALLAPVLLLLWQVLSPDCTEALAERLYQELQLEFPKFQRGEGHEVIVQQLRFGRGRGRDDLRGRGRLE